MKRAKRVLVAILICIMAMALPVSASAAKMNKSKATIAVGEKVQLRVNGTSKKITWKTSNKKVATVNKKGLVVGKKKGTAKITAKIGKKKYTCTVKVLAKNKAYEIENYNVNWSQTPKCNRQFMYFIYSCVVAVKYNSDGSVTAKICLYNNTLGKTYALTDMYIAVNDINNTLIAEGNFTWDNTYVYPMSTQLVTVKFPKEQVKKKLPVSVGIRYNVVTN